jgi:hypothetical protein
MSSPPTPLIPDASPAVTTVNNIISTEKELSALVNTFVGELLNPTTLAKFSYQIKEHLTNLISKGEGFYAYPGLEIIQIIPYQHGTDSIILKYITKETRTGKILKPDEVALGFYEGKWLYFGYKGCYAEEETADGVVVYTSANKSAHKIIAEARERAIALGAWIKDELHD